MNQWDDWGREHTFTIERPPSACYVYVAWGNDRSRPLYVGKARHPYARIATHMREKSWASDVEEWECHGFPSEGDAEWVEIEAIAALNPIHNVIRRWTQAERDERRRLLAEADARKAARMVEFTVQYEAARQRKAERTAKVVAKTKVERLAPRHPKPRRHVRWSDDVFTPDQLAIIRRVQDRGKHAA